MGATTDQHAEASVVVTPSTALYSTPVTIRITGVDPGTTVTLHARMAEDGDRWESQATFEADRDGVVDVTQQAPISGTYESADRMGLLWSMERKSSGNASGTDELTDTDVELAAVVEGETVATTAFKRVLLDDVEHRAITDRGLVAEYYEPRGQGPHPPVVLLGGPEGGYPSRKPAALLASKGYAVLAPAYFGIEGRPDALEGIGLEYLTTALDWLTARPSVQDAPVGIVGWSRGANLALLVGTRHPEVETVVAYAPSGIVFQGIPDGWYSAGSPWAEDGNDLPYVPYDFGSSFPLKAASRWVVRGRLQFKPIYERSLDSADDELIEDARIPVEELDASLLLLSGTDDRVWASPRFCQAIVDRLDRRGFDHRYTHRTYEGAGHVMGVPYTPTTDQDTVGTFVRGLPIDAGGSAAANARAARKSWQAVLTQLEEGLNHD